MLSVLLPSQPEKALLDSPRIDLPILSVPGLCCAIAGGDSRLAELVAAAWGLLYAAAHLLDGIEDADAKHSRGMRWNSGQTLNIATGLMTSASLSLCALEEAGVAPQTAQDIRNDFYRTGLKMSVGQHRDLTLLEPSLEQCWQIAEMKSGSFFALACRAGARLVSDDPTSLKRFGEFGLRLGVLIQIGNDVGGLWSEPGKQSDLVAGPKWTLPTAYAMAVLPASERSVLRQYLRAAAIDTNAKVKARAFILESGALLYLTVEAERRCRQAEAVLKATASPSAAQEELVALLHKVTSSVKQG